MLTYEINIGIIEHNVAYGIRKPTDQVRDRRLSNDDYRVLGRMLRETGAAVFLLRPNKQMALAIRPESAL